MDIQLPLERLRSAIYIPEKTVFTRNRKKYKILGIADLPHSYSIHYKLLFAMLYILKKGSLASKITHSNIVLASAEQKCSLYVHIPFCVRKCRYCAFTRRRLKRGNRLILQPSNRNCPSTAIKVFKNMFLGGGSPSAWTNRFYSN
jgi:coproporphyrinogen III oxidase-like Fe-S oxidoreductase